MSSKKEEEAKTRIKMLFGLMKDPENPPAVRKGFRAELAKIAKEHHINGGDVGITPKEFDEVSHEIDALLRGEKPQTALRNA